ncbi:hypothetical protein PENSPDRAFT_662016 [Peniophora sp. CONT]|nr:hypothetical protein PENSPDRAFT_662016 [Peniophora sp. CONT]
MADEYIALYTNTNRTSPWSHRLEIAFAEAGIEPTVGIISLQDKPEWFTSVVNPLTKEVPAIAYGGPKVPADQPSEESVKLTGSTVLLEFLADLYPSAGLLPKDPVQRAKARFFIEKVDSMISSPWSGFQQRNGHGPKELFLTGLETVQSLLPESGFVIGEWSIADASVAPILARAEIALHEDLVSWDEGEGPALHKEIFEGERFARLVKYLRDNQARESWKKTFNAVRPHLCGTASAKLTNYPQGAYRHLMKTRYGRSET